MSNRWHVAHSVRGRLRVRYPPEWLKPRRDAVEASLRAMPGVRGVAGSPLTGSVLIDYDPFNVAERALMTTLRELDAELDGLAAPTRAVPRRPARPRIQAPAPLIRLVSASSALALTVAGAAPAPVLAGLVLASGAPVLLGASTALARGRLNGAVLDMSTLLVLIARRNFPAAALLAGLRALGDWIVSRSVVRARRSLHDVVVTDDETATKRTPQGEVTLAAMDLRPGDVIVVRGPQRLPVDGVVVRGEALVNQQTMTGESLPVERTTRDAVFAGTVVEHGELEVRVDRVGLDTQIGQIVRAIEAATAEKSDIQLFAERLAERDVRRTLGLAAVGSVVARSLDAGIAILVADYGMAARVGIPTGIVTSMRRASTHGILMKGPRALEALARVNTVVFDKTGTLTSGTPRVMRVVAYAGVGEDAVLRLAGAAERGFRHPVARAIAAAAESRRLEPPAVARTNVSVGFGVDVEVEGQRVLVGSRRFMTAQRVDLRGAERDEAAAHAVGAAPTFVAANGRLLGMIILQDQLRPEARDAVLALRERAMRNVIMLSGDHPEPTRVIAESLGVRHHYAEVLPADKAELIRSLKAEGRIVAMVGDGANDALALSEADVGIAVPGGADLAVEAADVVILRGGLDRVVRAIDISRESIVAIRRSLGVAARANLAVVGLASLGLARPTTSILLAHGTTVAAAAVNAARPERVRRG